jgi:hypothetical protein
LAGAIVAPIGELSSPRGEAADEVAAGVVLIDEAIAKAGNIIVLGGILLGVGDKQRAVEVLDPKGRKVARDRIGPCDRIDDRVRAEVHEMEAGVEDVDGVIVEIAREDKGALRSRAQREQLVDGSVAGLVGCDHGVGRAQAGVPAGDGAILGRKEQGGRCAAALDGDDEAGRGVLDDSVGRGRGSGWAAGGRRDDDVCSLSHALGI